MEEAEVRGQGTDSRIEQEAKMTKQQLDELYYLIVSERADVIRHQQDCVMIRSSTWDREQRNESGRKDASDSTHHNSPSVVVAVVGTRN